MSLDLWGYGWRIAADENSIHYDFTPYPGESEPQHHWSIGDVAHLYADPVTGKIDSVDVDSENRGQGLARALYEHAFRQVDLYHDLDHHCTPEGLAFKRAVGGPTIPEHLGFNPHCVDCTDNEDDDDNHTAARLAMPLPLPEGITFHYHETDDTIPDGIYDQEFESPAVEARHNDDHVGYLAWDYDRYPAPTMVNVHPDYRRHGIGTALWDFARQHEPDLQHSENLTDLGEKWVNHEQSRTAGLDSLDDLAAAGYNTDEWSRWQGGGCLEYAHALLEKFPHLSAGALYRDDGEFSDFQHHFAHDDTHAYDSAGRHPLPYHGVHGDMKMLLNDDLGDYDEPDPDEVAAAHQHIERNGIGPRTDPHTASRRLAMPAPLPDDITFQLHRRQDTLDEAMRHSKFFADVPTVTAHLGDDPDPIGHLEWHGIDSGYPVGQVEFIHVKPEHRRFSVATSMFDWVKQNVEPRLHHSDERTELGRQWVDHEESRNKKARTMTAAVTVYTKPSCPQCVMTKKVLDKLGIEHDTVDVTADPEAHAYVTGLGYQQAPVVVVGDGEQHWSGFSPDKLKGLVE